jgi:hypothetical protein
MASGLNVTTGAKAGLDFQLIKRFRARITGGA